MKSLMSPITAPIARRKLRGLYQEKQKLLAALADARKKHGKVKNIQKALNQNCRKCIEWESWT